MEHVGYSLVDGGGRELQSWGDTPGQTRGVPDQIILPNASIVHCPRVGPIDDWVLVNRYIDWGADAAPPTLTDAGVVVTRALADLKTEYNKRVDADAETVRQHYITPGDGMALTYQEKFAQAQAVIAMGRDAANALSEAERRAQFPTLAASVGVEAQTLADVADLVVSRYAQFAQISYSIERARLSGKAAIQAATTADEVKAAYQAITWTQP
jgi:hypothetical protein